MPPAVRNNFARKLFFRSSVSAGKVARILDARQAHVVAIAVSDETNGFL
jgi:predicted transcriptional regulator